jgi:hypothetical protein
MLERPFLFVSALSLAACGGNVVVDGLGSTASSTGSGASSGSGGAPGATGSTGAGGATACLGPGAVGGLPAVPPALKACATVADCTMHDVDFCCGSLAVGVATAESAAYAAYAAMCFKPPPCGCAGPLRAEDGKMGNVELECAGGLCMSYVP